MGKEDTNDLIKFMKPFDAGIQALALWLRDFAWKLYPNCNELIYDNYNALALGWSPTEKTTDVFCSIALFNNVYVHFGFYWGSLLADPQKLLIGNGKQYRYIRVENKKDFPRKYVRELMMEAYDNVLARRRPEGRTAKNPILEKDLKLTGATIVKMISPKKKRPATQKK